MCDIVLMEYHIQLVKNLLYNPSGVQILIYVKPESA